MEPGDALLMQMKAKFPAPKRRTSRPKKVKKAKSIVEAEKSELLTVSNNSETTKLKKVRKSKKDRDSKKAKKSKAPKKEKTQIIEDEILSNQSDSSGTQPTRSSTDSGNVSDSNSSNSNLVSEEVSGHSSSGERSMTSFEETPTKPKKLSNRVAFFEQAIKVASTTKRRSSVDKTEVKTSTKKEQFLKAVEKSESSPTPEPTHKTRTERESRESAYVPIDSSESELYEYDASDPLDESPKIGLLYFTERDIRMEKKLIKKVAAEIEENGVGGVKPILTKKIDLA